MIEIPRALARQFRTVLRRLTPQGCPGGPCPFVLVQADNDGLILRSQVQEAAVQFQQLGSHQPESIAFSADALTAFEGRDGSNVVLEQVGPQEGKATWTEAGGTRTSSFNIVSTETLQPFPELSRVSERPN